MTLYYSMVFGLLVFEMVIFMALIVPLPFTWRRKLFTFISESPIIAKFQYGMKITFIFILILFIDSVNRVYRVQIELAAAKADGRGAAAEVLGGHARMEVQARKFYSQRNMYLCGFTLFLSLILNRTYVLILDVLRLEEEVKTHKSGSGKGDASEISKLKKELAAKELDLQTLRKQTEGLTAEYNRMGDQVSGQDKIPKKDR